MMQAANEAQRGQYEAAEASYREAGRLTSSATPEVQAYHLARQRAVSPNSTPEQAQAARAAADQYYNAAMAKIEQNLKPRTAGERFLSSDAAETHQAALSLGTARELSLREQGRGEEADYIAHQNNYHFSEALRLNRESDNPEAVSHLKENFVNHQLNL